MPKAVPPPDILPVARQCLTCGVIIHRYWRLITIEVPTRGVQTWVPDDDGCPRCGNAAG